MLDPIIIDLNIFPSRVKTLQLSNASIVADLLSLYNKANSPNPLPFGRYLTYKIFLSIFGSFGSVPFSYIITFAVPFSKI
jgi:hypothetical protein